jgi:hypothetical protein
MRTLTLARNRFPVNILAVTSVSACAATERDTKEVAMSGRAREMVLVDTTEAREETVQVQNMNHEKSIQRTTSENGLFFEGIS